MIIPLDLDLKNHIIKQVCPHLKKVFNKEITPKEAEYLIDYIGEESKEDKDYSFIEGLVKCAKIDLHSSRALFKQEIYSQSTYHLQQCIEKLTKAYGLYSGKINKDDLRPKNKKRGFWERWFGKKEESIGHQSPKTFILMLNKKSLKDRVNLLLKIFSQETDVDTAKKRIQKAIKLESYKLATMSKGEIKHLITLFENIHKNVKSQKNVLKGKITNFISSLKVIINNLEGFDSKQKEEIEKYINNFKLKSLDVLDVPINFLFLWLLAMITFPHSNWTRYPKEGSKQLDPSDYNLNLGIVGVQDHLLQITERRLINRFEQNIRREKQKMESKKF